MKVGDLRIQLEENQIALKKFRIRIKIKNHANLRDLQKLLLKVNILEEQKNIQIQISKNKHGLLIKVQRREVNLLNQENLNISDMIFIMLNYFYKFI